MDIKYFPITFITEKQDQELQIANSVVFSELMRNKKTVNIKHYLDSTQYGYTASALQDGTHKFVRITDIKNNGVDWDIVPYCNCENDTKFLLKENDILITRTGGTIGKSFIVKECPEKSVYASYLIRLRLKENVNIDFINMFLNSYLFWNQIFDLKGGAAIPNVNAEKLKLLQIPLCNLEEQNEIVNNNYFESQKQNTIKLFNINDSTSTEITRQLDLIKNLRQAFLREAMQGLLVNNETSDGKTGADLLAEIQAEKAQLVKEKKIKKPKPLAPITEEEIPFDIPENWTWCRLGEISFITSGSTPSSDSFVEKGIPYFKMYNLKNQKIDFWHKPQFIKEDVHNGSLKRCRLFPGDVIMNIVGPPLGKLAIIPNEFPEANFNQAAVLIRSYNLNVNPFIFWYLNEMSAINEIDTKGVAGQANISVTQAHEIKFPLPPLEIQERIVAKLDELMGYCDALEEQVKQSQQTNELLLQQVLREALGA